MVGIFSCHKIGDTPPFPEESKMSALEKEIKRLKAYLQTVGVPEAKRRGWWSKAEVKQEYKGVI